MHIDFAMFLLKQKKLNDTLLPLYIFLKLMPCTWIWKQKVSLIWATDFKQHMAVCGLSLHLGSSESRKTLEQKFIFQIGTLNPHGINERFSFN